MNGLSLHSITEDNDSNGTIYNLVFDPDSFSPPNLSVKLIADSITDSHGVPNAEVFQKLTFDHIELGNRIFLSGGNLIGVLRLFP